MLVGSNDLEAFLLQVELHDLYQLVQVFLLLLREVSADPTQVHEFLS